MLAETYKKEDRRQKKEGYEVGRPDVFNYFRTMEDIYKRCLLILNHFSEAFGQDQILESIEVALKAAFQRSDMQALNSIELELNAWIATMDSQSRRSLMEKAGANSLAAASPVWEEKLSTALNHILEKGKIEDISEYRLAHDACSDNVIPVEAIAELERLMEAYEASVDRLG